MKPDIIMQVCVFVDYPLWRRWLEKYRNHFNKVILYPSRHHGVIDLQKFLEEQVKETWVNDHVIDWTTPNIDWRMAEVTPCLDYVESDWIWFMEPDFFVRDWDRFFNDAQKLMGKSDTFGWWNETNFPYVHPCCLFIKRELLDRTNKDFRAHSEINGADHFAMVTHDAKKLGAKIIKLQDVGYVEWEDAFHLGGLTYPYQDFKGDDTIIGVKNPEAFMVYNRYSVLAPVVQSPEYEGLSKNLEEVLMKKYVLTDEVINKWKEFYI